MAISVDCVRLAQRAAGIVLKMVFEDGFFHAGPRPRNFFIQPGGRIGMIDFGMVGSLDARTQEQLTRVVLAVMSADTDQLVDAMLDLRVVRASLRRDAEQLLAHYTEQELGEFAIGRLLERTLAVVRRHHLQLPPNLALLLKTMIMNEGLGARLDPDFRLTTVLAPYAERLLLQQLAPTRLARRLSQASLDVAWLGVEMPQQLRHILGDLERGGLAVSVRPEDFEPLMRRFEQLANRIVLGILAAAFIAGLAVLLVIYPPAARRSGWGSSSRSGSSSRVCWGYTCSGASCVRGQGHEQGQRRDATICTCGTPGQVHIDRLLRQHRNQRQDGQRQRRRDVPPAVSAAHESRNAAPTTAMP